MVNLKKILVIEDNQDVRENIVEILELASYKVIEAINGKTGVDLAVKELPDLIICDIMMPELDGYGVLHLLNRSSETFGIPFIFLTAKSEKTDIRKGMDMGADDYLTKPFDRLELLNAIDVRLKKSEQLKTSFAILSNTKKDFINEAGLGDNIRLISNQREVYNYKKKHILYTEGQKPKDVYYIISGKVKVYKNNEYGKELITSIHTEGDFFGYNAVLENINYTDNAQVLEDTEVMFISADDFISLLINDTQVARQFIKLIAKNILAKEDMLVSLAYSSLRKKVAYGIVQVLDKYKKPDKENDILEVSRENLARFVGVATESLIRTLADFKAEKMIDLQAGKIIILNHQRLRDLQY